jgi:hypothetical protein
MPSIDDFGTADELGDWLQTRARDGASSPTS